MTSRKAPLKTIDEYIYAAPGEVQEKLHKLRACIRAAAPGAAESLKWGKPAFSYQRILVMFAVFKHHIGFFPTPSAVRTFENDYPEFATTSTSIKFPLDKPLPLSLIRKITEFRVHESLDEDKKWRTIDVSHKRGRSPR